MITPFSPLLPVPLLANFPPVSTLLTSKLGGKAGILSLAIGLRGGNVDNELAAAAFGWCSALGAPAALVAGAVLVTFSKTRTEMMPRKKDEKWVRSAKKMLRFLLLSSFGLEIISIFVTTVTGTVLLSQGDLPAVVHVGMHHNSPMGFLQSAHEFEYLTARITFLQGLFNWLAAVALEALIPNEGEGASARKMNQFVSSSLVTTILMMLSFYNRHMTFYSNYAEMLATYVVVFVRRYFWRWPPRPMSFVTLPAILWTAFLGVRALRSPPDDENYVMPDSN